MDRDTIELVIKIKAKPDNWRDGNFGITVYDRCDSTVFLNEGLDALQLTQTWLHEMMEAVKRAYGGEMDEKWFDILAKPIAQALIDTGWDARVMLGRTVKA